MRAPRVIHTATFGLAAFYAAMFAAGATLLVLFFDLVVSDYARHALRADLGAEVQLLLKTGHGDSAEITRQVRDREIALGGRQFHYLVTDPHGRRLAGDLPSSAARPGPSSLTVPAPADSRETPDETAEVRTLGVRLPGGGLLVAGRSTYDYHELRETMVQVTVVAAVFITLMSLVTAFLIGWRFLRRIDRLNAVSARIMNGRLDERLPTIGMGDEFDRLGANLNAMLDRIQGLMDGLQQVSSDIAHDLRTPLTRLRRSLDNALAQEGRHPERDALAHEAAAQIDEILATFSALLRIAQVEGGTGREAFRQVDLSELIERVRQAYEPVAEDQGKLLSADLVPGVIVAGDEELLTQLISNLIENAFTHAPNPGEVSLRVEVAGELATVSVNDRGPGVPAAEREQVMRRFYRLDRSRSTPGAGLGLSMAHAIAQLHGGQIRLTDNQPGLSVRVSLPLSTLSKIEN